MDVNAIAGIMVAISADSGIETRIINGAQVIVSRNSHQNGGQFQNGRHPGDTNERDDKDVTKLKNDHRHTEDCNIKYKNCKCDIVDNLTSSSELGNKAGSLDLETSQNNKDFNHKNELKIKMPEITVEKYTEVVADKKKPVKSHVSTSTQRNIVKVDKKPKQKFPIQEILKFGSLVLEKYMTRTINGSTTQETVKPKSEKKKPDKTQDKIVSTERILTSNQDEATYKPSKIISPQNIKDIIDFNPKYIPVDSTSPTSFQNSILRNSTLQEITSNRRKTKKGPPLGFSSHMGNEEQPLDFDLDTAFSENHYSKVSFLDSNEKLPMKNSFETVPISRSQNGNYVNVDNVSNKQILESPLLNGGIPIRPGEIITANSDLIVGRPKHGLKPGNLIQPQHNINDKPNLLKPNVGFPFNSKPRDIFRQTSNFAPDSITQEDTKNEFLSINLQGNQKERPKFSLGSETFDLRPPQYIDTIPKITSEVYFAKERPKYEETNHNTNSHVVETNVPLFNNNFNVVHTPNLPPVYNNINIQALEHNIGNGNPSQNIVVSSQISPTDNQDALVFNVGNKPQHIPLNYVYSSIDQKVNSEQPFSGLKQMPPVIPGGAQVHQADHLLVEVQPSKVANVIIPKDVDRDVVVQTHLGHDGYHSKGISHDMPLPYEDSGYFSTFNIETPQFDSTRGKNPLVERPILIDNSFKGPSSSGIIPLKSNISANISKYDNDNNILVLKYEKLVPDLHLAETNVKSHSKKHPNSKYNFPQSASDGNNAVAPLSTQQVNAHFGPHVSILPTNFGLTPTSQVPRPQQFQNNKRVPYPPTYDNEQHKVQKRPMQLSFPPNKPQFGKPSKVEFLDKRQPMQPDKKQDFIDKEYEKELSVPPLPFSPEGFNSGYRQGNMEHEHSIPSSYQSVKMVSNNNHEANRFSINNPGVHRYPQTKNNNQDLNTYPQIKTNNQELNTYTLTNNNNQEVNRYPPDKINNQEVNTYPLNKNINQELHIYSLNKNNQDLNRYSSTSKNQEVNRLPPDKNINKDLNRYPQTYHKPPVRPTNPHMIKFPQTQEVMSPPMSNSWNTLDSSTRPSVNREPSDQSLDNFNMATKDQKLTEQPLSSQTESYSFFNIFGDKTKSTTRDYIPVVESQTEHNFLPNMYTDKVYVYNPKIKIESTTHKIIPINDKIIFNNTDIVIPGIKIENLGIPPSKFDQFSNMRPLLPPKKSIQNGKTTSSKYSDPTVNKHQFISTTPKDIYLNLNNNKPMRFDIPIHLPIQQQPKPFSVDQDHDENVKFEEIFDYMRPPPISTSAYQEDFSTTVSTTTTRPRTLESTIQTESAIITSENPNNNVKLPSYTIPNKEVLINFKKPDDIKTDGDTELLNKEKGNEIPTQFNAEFNFGPQTEQPFDEDILKKPNTITNEIKIDNITESEEHHSAITQITTQPENKPKTPIRGEYGPSDNSNFGEKFKIINYHPESPPRPFEVTRKPINTLPSIHKLSTKRPVKYMVTRKRPLFSTKFTEKSTESYKEGNYMLSSDINRNPVGINLPKAVVTKPFPNQNRPNLTNTELPTLSTELTPPEPENVKVIDDYLNIMGMTPPPLQVKTSDNDDIDDEDLVSQAPNNKVYDVQLLDSNAHQNSPESTTTEDNNIETEASPINNYISEVIPPVKNPEVISSSKDKKPPVTVYSPKETNTHHDVAYIPDLHDKTDNFVVFPSKAESTPWLTSSTIEFPEIHRPDNVKFTNDPDTIKVITRLKSTIRPTRTVTIDSKPTTISKVFYPLDKQSDGTDDNDRYPNKYRPLFPTIANSKIVNIKPTQTFKIEKIRPTAVTIDPVITINEHPGEKTDEYILEASFTEKNNYVPTSKLTESLSINTDNYPSNFNIYSEINPQVKYFESSSIKEPVVIERTVESSIEKEVDRPQQFSTKFVTLTHTKTITHTKVDTVSSSTVKTLVLTEISTIFDVKTEIVPSTIKETITRHIPIINTVSIRLPSIPTTTQRAKESTKKSEVPKVDIKVVGNGQTIEVLTKPEKRPQTSTFKPFRSTKAKPKKPLDDVSMSDDFAEFEIDSGGNAESSDGKKSNEGEDSILIVMNKSQNGAKADVPPEQNSFEPDVTLGEESNNGVAHVLLGEILLANTPFLEANKDTGKIGKTCIPECRPSRNELCQRHDGAMRCMCRPGFARTFPDRPCKPTYTYSVKMGINVPDRRNTPTHLENAAKIMVMRSDLRDVLHAVNVADVKTKEVSADGVTPLEAELQLQLSENPTFDRIYQSIEKSLKSTNFSVGGTDISVNTSVANKMFAVEDFDECRLPQYRDCSENAECFNLRGTYTCSCLEGYTDISENKFYPGRICSADGGCAACNYHGACYSRDAGGLVCECFNWYTGTTCNINLKVVLISLSTLGAVLLILLALCIAMSCCRPKKDNTLKNGNTKRSTTMSVAPTSCIQSQCDNTRWRPGDRKSLINRAGSEAVESDRESGRNTSLPYMHSRKYSQNTHEPFFEVSGTVSSNDDLKLMIPRAKYRPADPQGPLMLQEKKPHSRKSSKVKESREVKENKLIEYLENGSDNSVNKRKLCSDGAAVLVSAGSTVSAVLNIQQPELKENHAGNLSEILEGSSDFGTDYKFYKSFQDGLDWSDAERRIGELTMSEARSFDGTLIRPSTKLKTINSRSQGSNKEAHTMAERDLGSTYLLPRSNHLYKHDGSDVSEFDSL